MRAPDSSTIQQRIRGKIETSCSGPCCNHLCGNDVATMRVLHINPGNLYGGVETVLVTFAAARDHCPSMAPEFAVMSDGRLERELKAAGAVVRRLPEVRMSRYWSVLRARRALRAFIATGYYNAVVCHQPWTQAVFGCCINGSSASLVAYLHGPLCRTWIERLASRTRPDLVVTPSAYISGSVRTLYPSSPVVTVHNPLPASITSVAMKADERRIVRAELGAADSDVVVLIACRIEAWKGVDLLISALAALKGVVPWRLWVAGAPQRNDERSYYKELEALVGWEDIARQVHFLGQRSDVSRLMGAADIYAQPNRSAEGFGLSLVEASYSRLPVVTSDLGPAREIIDNNTGCLVPPGDMAALSHALRSLICSPRLREEMGRAGRNKVTALCDAALQVNKLYAHLKSVCDLNQACV